MVYKGTNRNLICTLTMNQSYRPFFYETTIDRQPSKISCDHAWCLRWFGTAGCCFFAFSTSSSDSSESDSANFFTLWKIQHRLELFLFMCSLSIVSSVQRTPGRPRRCNTKGSPVDVPELVCTDSGASSTIVCVTLALLPLLLELIYFSFSVSLLNM
jgi:hypothetical protein